jgi:hypothetical protein
MNSELRAGRFYPAQEKVIGAPEMFFVIIAGLSDV